MASATAGLNDFLNSLFHAGTQRTTWYVMLINNSGYTGLAAGDTMSSHAGWTEITDYTSATRLEWTEGAAAGGSIVNSASITITFNAAVSIKGIALTTDNTKGGTTGILATSTQWLFPTVRTKASGESIAFTIPIRASI